jgi:hypothetical protein
MDESREFIIIVQDSDSIVWKKKCKLSAVRGAILEPDRMAEIKPIDLIWIMPA